jgi:hypothetical protein
VAQSRPCGGDGSGRMHVSGCCPAGLGGDRHQLQAPGYRSAAPLHGSCLCPATAATQPLDGTASGAAGIVRAAGRTVE